MSYYHKLLSKNESLAKVWLATHCDERLTRTEVLLSNIDENVKSIKNPKVE